MSGRVLDQRRRCAVAQSARRARAHVRHFHRSHNGSAWQPWLDRCAPPPPTAAPSLPRPSHRLHGRHQARRLGRLEARHVLGDHAGPHKEAVTLATTGVEAGHERKLLCIRNLCCGTGTTVDAVQWKNEHTLPRGAVSRRGETAIEREARRSARERTVDCMDGLQLDQAFDELSPVGHVRKRKRDVHFGTLQFQRHHRNRRQRQQPSRAKLPDIVGELSKVQESPRAEGRGARCLAALVHTHGAQRSGPAAVEVPRTIGRACPRRRGRGAPVPPIHCLARQRQGVGQVRSPRTSFRQCQSTSHAAPPPRHLAGCVHTVAEQANVQHLVDELLFATGDREGSAQPPRHHGDGGRTGPCPRRMPLTWLRRQDRARAQNERVCARGYQIAPTCSIAVLTRTRDNAEQDETSRVTCRIERRGVSASEEARSLKKTTSPRKEYRAATSSAQREARSDDAVMKQRSAKEAPKKRQRSAQRSAKEAPKKRPRNAQEAPKKRQRSAKEAPKKRQRRSKKHPKWFPAKTHVTAALHV